MKKEQYLVLFCAVFLWTGCGAENILNTGREFGTVTEESGAQQTPEEMEASAGQAFEASEGAEAQGNQASEGAEPGQESAAPGTETGPVFLSESMTQGMRFAYESLNEVEKLWYLDMEKALGNMEENIRLSEEGIEAGLDETDIGSIFQCVLNDHPELFFVEGYTYTKYSRGDRLLDIDFSGAYSMDREEALARKQQIEEGAAVMLVGIDAGAPEYDKVKYVYETIIRNTEYDLHSSDNQNIYSVFVNHRSVCQGYAKAAQYLLNRLGMECTLVMGTVDTGESHAWNLVKVDGSYYYLDTTWGDASYQIETPENTDASYMPEINYDYLCVTTQDLLRTHTLGGEVPMPECAATEANYYVREGALFTSYDREQMKRLFDRAKEQGRPDITVKCADTVCFREIMNALITGQEIFDYLSGGNGTIAYTHNEKQLSLTFWVTSE